MPFCLVRSLAGVRRRVTRPWNLQRILQPRLATETQIKDSSDSAEPVANTPTPPAAEATFADVTDSAGITFVHRELPGRMMPIGAGVVVLDFDGDKRDDIYFSNTNGANHLYRNRRDGGFEEVAAKAGVDDAEGEGNGGCAADYDNDGDIDLFVTNFGPSRLFQNGGDGTFEDVTEDVGLHDGELVLRSTGCAPGAIMTATGMSISS